MGIFSRFADIINSNVSALLDKAEDPEKMIRLIIQEMEDTLVEVRSNLVKAIADKKELSRRIEYIEEQVEDWQNKATLALTKQREDLARAALMEKQKVSDIHKTLLDEQLLVNENIDKLKTEIDKLESKITETRAKQQALMIRAKTAVNRKDVNQQLNSRKTRETMAKFEQFSRRIDELEAEADIHLDSQSSRNLEQEFMELQVEDEIENELQKLKQQLSEKESK
ncbi:phage shock protein PspA [Vibrio astriarenae]|jgi:phage shock protein A|uniref:Phage shock protein PspA n=1 Tax=Vibrio agarivorans TaxID=153622 RepID=A0ABT7XYV7_9VIBR|nr:phage shock protein PspA [Vibrio agarivorans]MDN2480932.1 phage shock protein PspA [Vibrio agarivorans]